MKNPFVVPSPSQAAEILDLLRWPGWRFLLYIPIVRGFVLRWAEQKFREIERTAAWYGQNVTMDAKPGELYMECDIPKHL